MLDEFFVVAIDVLVVVDFLAAFFALESDEIFEVFFVDEVDTDRLFPSLFEMILHDILDNLSSVFPLLQLVVILGWDVQNKLVTRF